MTWLPEPYPSPDRELSRLKFVLMGQYNGAMLKDLVTGSLVLSGVAALVGVVGFARRDV
jgi:hypothetical protein